MSLWLPGQHQQQIVSIQVTQNYEFVACASVWGPFWRRRHIGIHFPFFWWSLVASPEETHKFVSLWSLPMIFSAVSLPTIFMFFCFGLFWPGISFRWLCNTGCCFGQQEFPWLKVLQQLQASGFQWYLALLNKCGTSTGYGEVVWQIWRYWDFNQHPGKSQFPAQGYLLIHANWITNAASLLGEAINSSTGTHQVWESNLDGDGFPIFLLQKEVIRPPFEDQGLSSHIPRSLFQDPLAIIKVLEVN